MKAPLEIERAHDILCAVINREVPTALEKDSQSEHLIIAALDVLCWVLEHEHNSEFASNLARIELMLAQKGFLLREIV